MKRLIFATIVVSALALADTAPAMENPVFVKPAPQPNFQAMPPVGGLFRPGSSRRLQTLPRIPVLNPTQVPEGAQVVVMGPYWSFDVRSDTSPGDKFAMTLYFENQGTCEEARGEMAIHPDATYISGACSKTD